MRWDNFKTRVLKSSSTTVTFRATIKSQSLITYEGKDYELTHINPHESIKFLEFIGHQVTIEVTKRKHLYKRGFVANSFDITQQGEQPMTEDYKAPSLASIKSMRDTIPTVDKYWKIYPRPGEAFILVGFSDDLANPMYQWKRHYVNGKIIMCEGEGKCDLCVDAPSEDAYSIFAVHPDRGLSIMTISGSNLKSMMYELETKKIENPFPDYTKNEAVAFTPYRNKGMYLNFETMVITLDDITKEQISKCRIKQRLINALNYYRK